MELVLPRNYVEIEQEEMVYLDGGDSRTFANNINGLLTKMGISYSNRIAHGIPTNQQLLKMSWPYVQVYFPALAAKISSITLNPAIVVTASALAAIGGWAMWNKRIFY